MLGNLSKLCTALCAAAIALVLGLTVAAPGATGSTGATAPRTLPGYGIHAMQFNILSSMMAPGGRLRARRAARQVKLNHRDVVAFQEVGADQYHVLHDRLPGFSFYPRRTLGTFSSALQVAWKDARFKVRRTDEIYRPFLGKPRAIPYVQLEDRTTHRRFWVLSIHNSPGGREAERDISTRKEIRLIRRLQGLHQGPVLVLGDMNEKIEFCTKVAAAARQISMNGSATHPCPVPHAGGMDWMLGTQHGERFSRYRKVFNHISDHPMVLSNVWVTAATA